MQKLFRQPHPFVFNAYSILIPSGITFLIIVVLAPFNFQEFELYIRIILGLITTFIVALGIFLSVRILQKLFPKIMSEDRWTVGKEFLLILFVLFILTFLISLTLWILEAEYQSMGNLFLKTTFITLGISVLPVLVLVLFEQYRYQKQQLQKAKNLNKTLRLKETNFHNETISSENLEAPLLIKSDKGQIELKLLPKELLYIKSEGNYLEVFYLHTKNIKKQLIRNTLKNIEDVLPEQVFLRCHNRFIINGHHILKVEGNARNLILHLKEVSETIPISRAKAKSITGFLERLS